VTDSYKITNQGGLGTQSPELISQSSHHPLLLESHGV